MGSALELVLHAAAFAAEKHRHQRRKDEQATPYINHPLAVAKVLSREARIQDAIVLAAALLQMVPISGIELAHRIRKRQFNLRRTYRRRRTSNFPVD